MKNQYWWYIDYRKFLWEEAQNVGSYYNISHEPEPKPGPFNSEPKFKPELSGTPFNIKEPIGFIKS